MPSLPVLTLANHYTLIVQSANSNSPSFNWRNTWDIHSPSGIAPAPADPIITALVNFHRACLRTDAFVEKLTLRNWSQGPQPFAGRPFLWESIIGLVAGSGLKTNASPTGFGGQGAGTQSISGTACARLQRLNTVSGKNPNMFLRGFLDEDDIAAGTGASYGMIGSSRVTTVTFQQVEDHFLGAYENPGSGVELVNIHVGNHHVGPPFDTPIQDIVFVGVTENKRTRKNKK